MRRRGTSAPVHLHAVYSGALGEVQLGQAAAQERAPLWAVLHEVGPARTAAEGFDSEGPRYRRKGQRPACPPGRPTRESRTGMTGPSEWWGLAPRFFWLAMRRPLPLQRLPAIDPPLLERSRITNSSTAFPLRKALRRATTDALRSTHHAVRLVRQACVERCGRHPQPGHAGGVCGSPLTARHAQAYLVSF